MKADYVNLGAVRGKVEQRIGSPIFRPALGGIRRRQFRILANPLQLAWVD